MIADGAEGLVDAQSRLQDRIDELAELSGRAARPTARDPARLQRLEGYRLARVALAQQLKASSHPARRLQLEQAIAEIDRRIAAESAA